MIDLDEIFAKRLAEIIKNSNLSYETIVKDLGFRTKSTIWKYANCKTINIGPSAIYRIANYFKVSPSWLAGFTDDKYYNTDFNK